MPLCEFLPAPIFTEATREHPLVCYTVHFSDFFPSAESLTEAQGRLADIKSELCSCPYTESAMVISTRIHVWSFYVCPIDSDSGPIACISNVLLSSFDIICIQHDDVIYS